MKSTAQKIMTALLALSVTLPTALPEFSAFRADAVSQKQAEWQSVRTESIADAAPVTTTATSATYYCTTGLSNSTTATTVTTCGCDDYVERLKHTYDPDKDYSGYKEGIISIRGDSVLEHEVGGKLDFSQIYISGSGSYVEGDETVHWDFFDETVADRDYAIDYGNYNPNQPGKYKLTLYVFIGEPDARGGKTTFEVTVTPKNQNGTTGMADSTETTTTTTAASNFSGSAWISGEIREHHVGEELDLSDVRFSAFGSDGTEEQPINWDIFDESVLNSDIEIDDAEYDSSKPGVYTIHFTLLLNGICDTTQHYRIPFDGEVTVTAAPQTTCVTTSIPYVITGNTDWNGYTPQPGEYNWYWTGDRQTCAYEGAPAASKTDEDRAAYVGEEIQIEMPYFSKNHTPLYDTRINLDNLKALKTSGNPLLFSDSYFEFTDTAIVWHANIVDEGTCPLDFYVESPDTEETAIYSFTLNTKFPNFTLTTTTAVRCTNIAPYAGTADVIMEDSGKTTYTMAYPVYKDGGDHEFTLYDVNVETDSAEYLKNNDGSHYVMYSKDAIIARDPKALAVNAQQKAVHFTVASRNGVYKMTYNFINEMNKKKFLPNTGDINLDQTMDVKDAVYLSRICGGDSSIILSDVQEKQADINGDGHLNSLDITLMLRRLAKLI